MTGDVGVSGTRPTCSAGTTCITSDPSPPPEATATAVAATAYPTTLLEAAARGQGTRPPGDRHEH